MRGRARDLCRELNAGNPCRIILDACALNQKYWVFAAGLTNQQVEITVTDTSHNVKKTYTNPLGKTFVTITDTSAFSTCP